METKPKAREFVRWALSHVKRESIPEDAELVLPRERCGLEPWNYLFGSTRVRTNEANLDLYYRNHYSSRMTRERYDALTADWDREGFATDCQGLLDAFLTYEKGEPTDINADMNWRLWCPRGEALAGSERPFVPGEAVFRRSGGRMTHVGWICGFLGGEPLVVEARGIAYGVVVTKLGERDFTHRGLMDARFDYTEENEDTEMESIIFERTSPMARGESYLAMQRALNLAGYRDEQGRPLEEDGIWGDRSQEAFLKLIQAHSPADNAENTETDAGAGETPDGACLPAVLIAGGVRVTVERA